MMRHISLAFLFAVSSVFFLSGCADDADRKLEEIRFLLDDGKYDQALELAQGLVEDHPDNLKAQFYLAEANLASGGLSGGNPNCEDGDVGMLGLLACLQDDNAGGESNMSTFRRIAPATEAKLAQVQTATDLLVELSSTELESKNLYLLLFLSRLFEISGPIVTLGAIEPGSCSNGNTLSSTEEARFDENLDTIESDGKKAGLPEDFSLFTRIGEIQQEIEDAASLSDFFQHNLCS